MQATSLASGHRDDDESIEMPPRDASGLPASGTELSRRVQCWLCGQWLREVGSRHVKRAHGMTLAEYHRAVDKEEGG
jgi:hypothetical protein